MYTTSSQVTILLVFAARASGVVLASQGSTCGPSTLLPHWGDSCTPKNNCTLLKEIKHVINATLCCEICSSVTTTTAWSLNLDHEICHCKIVDIRKHGSTNKNTVSGWYPSGPTLPPTLPPTPPPAPKGAKNLLYLVVDDLRNELTYTNSRKGLVTPNIDALAEKGMIFSRAYVQQGVCSPSRNSFLSGRRPDTTQIWNFQHSFRDTLGNNVSSWPGAFKNAGWITSGMGKVYHPSHPAHDDGDLSWSLDFAPYFHPSKFTNKISKAPDSAFQDGQITSAGLARIDQWAAAKKKDATFPPFFIAVGLHKPHIPWVMPQRFLDMQVPVASIDTATRDVPPVGYCNVSLYTCDNVYSGLPWEPAAKVDQADHRRKYRAAVTWTDYNVGLLIAKLAEHELSDDTAIVFHGDHGWHLGEQGAWCKQSNFDLVARVPLIVYVPWITASHGQTSDALVEIVDLFPTTLEIFGIHDATHVHDIATLEEFSFAPLLNTPSTAANAWKNATFTQYPRCLNSKGFEPWEYPSSNACTSVASDSFRAMGYSIRTDRWRYTLWVKWDGKHLKPAGWTGDNVVGIELYDHQGDDGMDTDKFDNENVAEANPAVCAQHKAALIAGWKPARPAMK